MSMPTTLHRRALLRRFKGHGSDARPDIEKAAGERRGQLWTVTSERDNTADVVARALALGLKYGGIPKNPPGRAVRIAQ